MKLPLTLLLAVAPFGVFLESASASRWDDPPLDTVDEVDLERYTGLWYEIASFPHPFQRGCTATTATYTLREDGGLDVVNRCRLGSLDGPELLATGEARAADEGSDGKLEVRISGRDWGDYWILDLGPDYEYSVVGHPTRDYLWILSRTPTLPDATWDAILDRLEEQDYDTDRLERTEQPDT